MEFWDAFVFVGDLLSTFLDMREGARRGSWQAEVFLGVEVKRAKQCTFDNKVTILVLWVPRRDQNGGGLMMQVIEGCYLAHALSLGDGKVNVCKLGCLQVLEQVHCKHNKG